MRHPKVNADNLVTACIVVGTVAVVYFMWQADKRGKVEYEEMMLTHSTLRQGITDDGN